MSHPCTPARSGPALADDICALALLAAVLTAVVLGCLAVAHRPGSLALHAGNVPSCGCATSHPVLLDLHRFGG